jgi:hypothetical protein
VLGSAGYIAITILVRTVTFLVARSARHQKRPNQIPYSRFHINQPQIVGWALPTKLYCYGFCELVGDAHPTGNRCKYVEELIIYFTTIADWAVSKLFA